MILPNQSMGTLRNAAVVSLNIPVGHGLLPQLRARGGYWQCLAEHREAGFPMDLSSFFCQGEIGEPPPGYEPGPSGPVCRPRCSRCQVDDDSPTGRSKVCIKADCDSVDRPC